MAQTLTDARQRALRTLAQGLALDVAAAVVMVLSAALPGVEWTGRWWLALLGLLGKTALTAVASWAHRQVLPPVAPPG